MRPPWRRLISGADSALPEPAPSTASSESAHPTAISAASSSISGSPRVGGGPLKRLTALFKESDVRADENLKSLKRRVVQVRRQPDAAPVRFQLGFRSRTGWEPIRAAKENQDCLVALVPWGPGSAFNLFGALDGHGRNGHQCAIFVAQKVVAYLAKTLVEDAQGHAIAVTLHKAVLYAERKLEAYTSIVDFQLSGSTGVFVLVRGATLFCANVGDSRAVVGREKEAFSRSTRRSHAAGVVPLPDSPPPQKNGEKKWKTQSIPRSACYFPVPISVDQKPSRPDEKKRLLAAGARVDAWEGMDVGEERVWLPEARTPGLAVSRSFGDLLVKSYGVNCTPEVYSLELCEDDRFMVMASDGVFEFISSQEVVDVVGRWRDRGSAQEAAEELVKLSLERWIEDDSVIDDISCVVVFMNVLTPEVSGPKDPVFLETSVGTAENASEVDHSPSSRNLTTSRSLPDGLELVTPSSSGTPLPNELRRTNSLEFDEVDAFFDDRDQRRFDDADDNKNCDGENEHDVNGLVNETDHQERRNGL